MLPVTPIGIQSFDSNAIQWTAFNGLNSYSQSLHQIHTANRLFLLPSKPQWFFAIRRSVCGWLVGSSGSERIADIASERERRLLFVQSSGKSSFQERTRRGEQDASLESFDLPFVQSTVANSAAFFRIWIFREKERERAFERSNSTHLSKIRICWRI